MTTSFENGDPVHGAYGAYQGRTGVITKPADAYGLVTVELTNEPDKGTTVVTNAPHWEHAMADVAAARDAVAALLDPEREAVIIIYPADAAALNQGAAGLMLSAAVVPTCDSCGQDVVFTGRHVEGYFRDGLIVQSERSRQHRCGTWAPPIVDVDWNVDDPFDPEALVAALRSRAETARADRDAATGRRLRRELAEFLALPEDERKATGTDWEPGIYHNGNSWMAWDYDASQRDGSWDTIDVTEADLAGEDRS